MTPFTTRPGYALPKIGGEAPEQRARTPWESAMEQYELYCLVDPHFY